MTNIERAMIAVLVLVVLVFAYHHMTVIVFVRIWMIAVVFVIGYGVVGLVAMLRDAIRELSDE